VCAVAANAPNPAQIVTLTYQQLYRGSSRDRPIAWAGYDERLHKTRRAVLIGTDS
jgi:hypothetical protein